MVKTEFTAGREWTCKEANSSAAKGRKEYVQPKLASYAVTVTKILQLRNLKIVAYQGG